MLSNYNEMSNLLFQVQKEEESIPRCMQSINIFIDEDEILGLKTIERPDREFERGSLEDDGMGGFEYIPETEVNIDLGNAYWTRSGECPVVEDLASKNDMIPRLERENDKPFWSFYSASSFSKKRFREFENRMVEDFKESKKIREAQKERITKMKEFIENNKNNPAMLRAAWNKMWKRVNSYKEDWAKMAREYINWNQIMEIREEFHKVGIRKKQ